MSLGQDLKLGVRVLQKSPGLVAVAALSIGLGIGVNTTMFSVLHAALFDRPEVDAPEQLVNVYTRRENSEGFGTNSIADWRDLRERSESLSDLAGYSLALMNVERGGRPSLEVGSIVTPGYFEMLGVDAQHGRRFLPEEQERGAAPVVLLTHRYWERAFAQDPSAIGDSLRIGGADFTIAGVLPQGFNGLLRGI
ncbi:MAG: ABC transporter permease, partial [Acidobacteriota bacterium]